MLTPPPPIWHDGETLGDQLSRAGVSRRDLLNFGARMAAIFALGPLLPGQSDGYAREGSLSSMLSGGRWVRRNAHFEDAPDPELLDLRWKG